MSTRSSLSVLIAAAFAVTIVATCAQICTAQLQPLTPPIPYNESRDKHSTVNNTLIVECRGFLSLSHLVYEVISIRTPENSTEPCVGIALDNITAGHIQFPDNVTVPYVTITSFRCVGARNSSSCIEFSKSVTSSDVAVLYVAATNFAMRPGSEHVVPQQENHFSCAVLRFFGRVSHSVIFVRDVIVRTEGTPTAIGGGPAFLAQVLYSAQTIELCNSIAVENTNVTTLVDASSNSSSVVGAYAGAVVGGLRDVNRFLVSNCYALNLGRAGKTLEAVVVSAVYQTPVPSDPVERVGLFSIVNCHAEIAAMSQPIVDGAIVRILTLNGNFSNIIQFTSTDSSASLRFFNRSASHLSTTLELQAFYFATQVRFVSEFNVTNCSAVFEGGNGFPSQPHLISFTDGFSHIQSMTLRRCSLTIANVRTAHVGTGFPPALYAALLAMPFYATSRSTLLDNGDILIDSSLVLLRNVSGVSPIAYCMASWGVGQWLNLKSIAISHTQLTAIGAISELRLFSSTRVRSDNNKLIDISGTSNRVTATVSVVGSHARLTVWTLPQDLNVGNISFVNESVSAVFVEGMRGNTDVSIVVNNPMRGGFSSIFSMVDCSLHVNSALPLASLFVNIFALSCYGIQFEPHQVAASSSTSSITLRNILLNVTAPEMLGMANIAVVTARNTMLQAHTISLTQLTVHVRIAALLYPSSTFMPSEFHVLRTERVNATSLVVRDLQLSGLVRSVAQRSHPLRIGCWFASSTTQAFGALTPTGLTVDVDIVSSPVDVATSIILMKLDSVAGVQRIFFGTVDRSNRLDVRYTTLPFDGATTTATSSSSPPARTTHVRIGGFECGALPNQQSGMMSIGGYHTRVNISNSYFLHSHSVDFFGVNMSQGPLGSTSLLFLSFLVVGSNVTFENVSSLQAGVISVRNNDLSGKLLVQSSLQTSPASLDLDINERGTGIDSAQLFVVDIGDVLSVGTSWLTRNVAGALRLRLDGICSNSDSVVDATVLRLGGFANKAGTFVNDFVSTSLSVDVEVLRRSSSTSSCGVLRLTAFNVTGAFHNTPSVAVSPTIAVLLRNGSGLRSLHVAAAAFSANATRAAPRLTLGSCKVSVVGSAMQSTTAMESAQVAVLVFHSSGNASLPRLAVAVYGTVSLDVRGVTADSLRLRCIDSPAVAGEGERRQQPVSYLSAPEYSAAVSVDNSTCIKDCDFALFDFSGVASLTSSFALCPLSLRVSNVTLGSNTTTFRAVGLLLGHDVDVSDVHFGPAAVTVIHTKSLATSGSGSFLAAIVVIDSIADKVGITLANSMVNVSRFDAVAVLSAVPMMTLAILSIRETSLGSNQSPLPLALISNTIALGSAAVIDYGCSAATCAHLLLGDFLRLPVAQVELRKNSINISSGRTMNNNITDAAVASFLSFATFPFFISSTRVFLEGNVAAATTASVVALTVRDGTTLWGSGNFSIGCNSWPLSVQQQLERQLLVGPDSVHPRAASFDSSCIHITTTKSGSASSTRHLSGSNSEQLQPPSPSGTLSSSQIPGAAETKTATATITHNNNSNSRADQPQAKSQSGTHDAKEATLTTSNTLQLDERTRTATTATDTAAIDVTAITTLPPLHTSSATATSTAEQQQHKTETQSSQVPAAAKQIATATSTKTQSHSEQQQQVNAAPLVGFSAAQRQSAEVAAQSSAVAVAVLTGPAGALDVARGVALFRLIGCASTATTTAGNTAGDAEAQALAATRNELSFPDTLFPGSGFGAQDGYYLRAAVLGWFALNAVVLLLLVLASVVRKTPPTLGFLSRTFAFTVAPWGIELGTLLFAGGSVGLDAVVSIVPMAVVLIFFFVLSSRTMKLLGVGTGVSVTLSRVRPALQPAAEQQQQQQEEKEENEEPLTEPASAQPPVAQWRTTLANLMTENNAARFLFVGYWTWTAPASNVEAKRHLVMLGPILAKFYGPPDSDSGREADKRGVALPFKERFARIAPFFFVWSSTVTVLTCALSGAALASPQLCGTISWIVALLAFFDLALLALMRPQIVPAMGWLSVLSNVCLIAGAVVAFVGSKQSEASSVASMTAAAQALALWAVTALGLVRCVLQGLKMTVFAGAKLELAPLMEVDDGEGVVKQQEQQQKRSNSSDDDGGDSPRRPQQRERVTTTSARVTTANSSTHVINLQAINDDDDSQQQQSQQDELLSPRRAALLKRRANSLLLRRTPRRSAQRSDSMISNGNGGDEMQERQHGNVSGDDDAREEEGRRSGSASQRNRKFSVLDGLKKVDFSDV